MAGVNHVTTKIQTETDPPDAEGCPFCGSLPVIEPWHGGSSQKRMVSCQNDRCAVNPMVTGETRRTALKSWNTRVSP